MRIYVAGPMRGREHFNFPAFQDATARLRDAGHEVFSPAERDLEHGFDPYGMTGHEDLAELGFDLREALAADTAWISTHADAVCVLDGWERSSGARAEMALAAALGLRAGTVADFDAGTTRYAAALLDEALSTPTPPPSGEVRMTSSTGGQKGSKAARFDLIPVGPLWELAELYGRGAAKYEARNYERGYAWSLSFAAMQRHAWAWWNGEDTDPEMGTSHLASVAWHAFALLLFTATHPEFDDRPTSG